MKDLWKKIRELWKIPRYHAIMVLALYFIFFASIFLITSFRKPTVQKETITKTALQNYAEMMSYEYTYTLQGLKNNQSFEEKIKGIFYQNKNSFKYQYKTYQIIDQNIYLEEEIVEDLFDFDIVLLEPTNILSYLEESTEKEISKNVVKYEDGTIKTEYKITYLEDESLLIITTYEQNNQISQIELDVTNLLQNEEISAYQILIEYNSVNQISEYIND